jgi:transposase-like protein
MKVHKRRRISRQKYQIIFRGFVTDIPASKAAEIAGVNRKTGDRYYNIFRKAILKGALEERSNAHLGNGIEIDESYFGPRRVRGKRGRGASGKVVVFGILKRKGRIYTQIVRKAEKKELMPIIQKVVKSGSDIYSDGWKSYNALAIYGYNHKKVKHSEDEFARSDGTHINGVESFWSWAKRRLAKFNGIKKGHFQLYLLECEWRFNHRENLDSNLRKLLRKI